MKLFYSWAIVSSHKKLFEQSKEAFIPFKSGNEKKKNTDLGKETKRRKGQPEMILRFRMLMNVLSKSLRWLFFLVLLTLDSQLWLYVIGSNLIRKSILYCTRPGEDNCSFFSLYTIEVGDYHQLPIHSVRKLICVFIYVFIYLFVQIHLCLPELPVQASLRPWLFLQRHEGEMLYFLLNKYWWHFERFRISCDYSVKQNGEDCCAEWGLGWLISFPLCTSRCWTSPNHKHLASWFLSSLTCPKEKCLFLFGILAHQHVLKGG